MKELGSIPERDHYFLGQANLGKGIVDDSMLDRKKGKLDEFNPLAHASLTSLRPPMFPRAFSR